MKIFKTVQRHYATLGISSSSNQWTRKYPFDERVFVGFFLFGCIIASHLVYIFHVANGFMECMVGICTTSGITIIFVCFSAVVHKKILLFRSIDSIEKILDTRSNYPKSKRFFLKRIQEVEQLTEIVFMVVVKICVQLITLPKFIVSFGLYVITDSGRDSFQLPLPMWFPFDWNNPIGYFIAFALEHTTLSFEFFITACTLALGMGACWFAISATKDIQRILRLINEKGQANVNELNALLVLFSEFVDIHGAVKQLIRDFSSILQPIIMSLFTWSLLAISGALLFIQVELVHHKNIMPLVLLILNGIIGLSLVFIVCEICQKMNDVFEEIDFTIDQLHWYLLPIEIQRQLPMIIANAQQPVSIECFGSIACTRDAFKNIIHRAFSYFMVLRQLSD